MLTGCVPKKSFVSTRVLTVGDSARIGAFGGHRRFPRTRSRHRAGERPSSAVPRIEISLNFIPGTTLSITGIYLSDATLNLFFPGMFDLVATGGFDAFQQFACETKAFSSG